MLSQPRKGTTVNLRSRLIAMGCFILCLQMAGLFALFYYYITPKIAILEQTMVEKNLHRSLELLQRELFHLEHLTKLLAEEPIIKNLVNITAGNPIPNDVLLQKMIRQELNLMYILNNDHKVIWEQLLDLNTEQPYPNQPFLSSLWENRPQFLEHSSLLHLNAGLYNTTLGPMLLVSIPIEATNNPSKVQGSIIVGKLITLEVQQLIQTLSYSDLTFRPLGSNILNKKQLDIVNKLSKDDTVFVIEKSNTLFRGYTSLPDLSEKSTLLISATQPREFSQVMQTGLLEIGSVLVIVQILFLALLSFFLRRSLLLPIHLLTDQINQTTEKWIPPIKINAQSEIGMLNMAMTNFMSRQQMQLMQETTYAFRDGMHQTRQNLTQTFEETLEPLVEGLNIIEKKLSNLPTNDIEWIIAEGKTGQISLEHLAEYTERLQIINEKLRAYKKEMRQRLYDLHAKSLRNAALLRSQSRSHYPNRQFTPISVYTRKENYETARS